MANGENRSGHRRVHRGKARQVTRKLSSDLCSIHNNDRHDTRVGNPLFHASPDDVNRYRSGKANETQT